MKATEGDTRSRMSATLGGFGVVVGAAGGIGVEVEVGSGVEVGVSAQVGAAVTVGAEVGVDVGVSVGVMFGVRVDAAVCVAKIAAAISVARASCLARGDPQAISIAPASRHTVPDIEIVLIFSNRFASLTLCGAAVSLVVLGAGLDHRLTDPEVLKSRGSMLPLRGRRVGQVVVVVHPDA
jgi:hypothetical protein